MYKLTTGWRIKMRRKMLGMTQVKLSEKMGITQPALCQLEMGVTERPSASTKAALCEHLHCDRRWLFDGNIDYAPKGFYSPMYNSAEMNK